MLSRSTIVLAALGLLASVPLASSAADTPLAALPADTAAVVRFKTPADTIEKAVAFVEKADQGYGDQLRQMSAAVGSLISNPAQTGVDPEKDWWLAVFLESGSDPGVVFIVPAKDVAAMRGAIQGEYHFVEHEDWLLYTESEPTAEQLRDHLAKNAADTIADVIDAESQKLLDGGDLAAYVNVTQMKKVYRSEIDGFQQQVDDTLGRIAEAMPPGQGMNLGAIFEVYGSIAEQALQALEDTEGLAAALNVGEQHVSADALLKLTSDSATDKFLQAHPPAEIDRLGQLPGGKHIYVGIHGYTDVMMKWGVEMALAMIELDDEAAKTVETAVEQYGKLDFGSMAFFMGLGDADSGILSYGTVSEIAPSDKAREITRDLAPAYGSMQFPGLRQEIEYKADAEKIGELPIDHMRVKQEFDETGGPFNAQSIMNIMFGPEGINTRLAYPEGLQVQTLGGGTELMAEVLKSLDGDENADNAAASEAFRATRAQLSEKANVVLLVDAPSMAVEALRLVIESGFLPIPLDKSTLNTLDVKESYLGFAVTTEPAAVRAKAYIPLDQVRGITQLVRTFLGSLGGPQNEL